MQKMECKCRESVGSLRYKCLEVLTFIIISSASMYKVSQASKTTVGYVISGFKQEDCCRHRIEAMNSISPDCSFNLYILCGLGVCFWSICLLVILYIDRQKRC